MYPATITNTQIESLPLAFFEGEIIDVTDDAALRRAVGYLSEQTCIGFDTETKPCFTAHPRVPSRTALLQFSTAERAFLVHLASTGIPPYLADLLTSPRVIKVGAAIRDDIRGLQRYTPFEPAGFVDLQTLVQDYGIQEKSVKKLAAIVLHLRVSKSQRLSNWESVPLTPAQQQYAAVDAYVCCEIFKKLKNIS